MKVLRNLGQCVNVSLNKIGKVTDFIISIFSNLVTPPFYGREILKPKGLYIKNNKLYFND